MANNQTEQNEVLQRLVEVAAGLDHRFGSLEQRFGGVEQRLANLESGFERLTGEVGHLKGEVGHLTGEVGRLTQDVRRTEQGLNSLRSAQSYWPRLQDEVRIGASGDRFSERRGRYAPLLPGDQD